MKMRMHLLLSFCLLLISSAALAQQIEVNKNNRTIAVTATDKATADADTAVVHIGFQIFAADEKAAYALGSKTSNAIADALKKAGIARRVDPERDTEHRTGAALRKPERAGSAKNAAAIPGGPKLEREDSAKNAASVLTPPCRPARTRAARSSGPLRMKMRLKRRPQAAR